MSLSQWTANVYILFTLELRPVECVLQRVFRGYDIMFPPFILVGGFDPTYPASHANTSDSVICAMRDTDFWSVAGVKAVGTVIFLFILITSLEWVFATGEITNEHLGEPWRTGWFERSFWYLFFYWPEVGQ